MEPSKSQVDIYVNLFELMLRCDPCGIASKKSLMMDTSTLRRRTHYEGLSFLTKTLPRLGKAFDLGLASTLFKLPLEFHSSHENTSIPAFMQDYFKRVFDADGVLLDEVEPLIVKHIRQVLLFAYKLSLPFRKDQISSTIEGFISTDGELKLQPDESYSRILEVASFITADVFQDFDPKDILPRHGPGAVATGEKLDAKWNFSRRYDAIHQMYPYYNYFVVGSAELLDRKEWYMNLERLDQGRAKVVLVPKDSRGPRLISCEPLEYQWVQQGLGRKIVQHLESHWLTRGQINFTLQSINRALALSSSLDRSYATLDLKDASDRVSLELVRAVFKRTPSLLRALEATRTSSTLLPDGRVVEFKKFAPMGSALCFPTEAFIFWVLLVAAESVRQRAKQRVVGKSVFVYGDDIIVPTNIASLCIQHLEAFDLKVNASKCCIQGPFRESCGMDAFNGVPVTPVRLRTPWSGRADVSTYVSWIELANALFAAGYANVADSIWASLEGLYGKVPYGTSRASYPCRLVDSVELAEELNSRAFRRRHRRRYQQEEFLVPRLIPRRKKTTLDGWQRMLRNLMMPPFSDPSAIVIPRSMIINRGWTPTH